MGWLCYGLLSYVFGLNILIYTVDLLTLDCCVVGCWILCCDCVCEFVCYASVCILFSWIVGLLDYLSFVFWFVVGVFWGCVLQIVGVCVLLVG